MYLDKTTFRKKTHKDTSGKPKVTPFLLWAKSVRSNLEVENIGKDFVTLKTRLGEMWMDLTDAEKYSWKRRAQRLSLKSSEAVDRPLGLSQVKGKASLKEFATFNTNIFTGHFTHWMY